ncbi:MAG: hypothetical protein ACO3VI_10700, partial [Ilumatobacteraceae bacterium]
AASESVTIIIVAVWFVGGLLLIPRFGLHYDEALFINAATDGLVNSSEELFIRSRFLGLPVLLMDYIGALKSWIFAPIFLAVEPSTWSVRVPTLLGAAGGIWITTRAVEGQLQNLLRPTLAAVLATSISPTLLLTFDIGPSVIAFVCRSLLILILVKVARDPNLNALPRALDAVLVVVLGTFNKLDFAVFGVPCLAAVLLLAWRPLLAAARARRAIVGSVVLFVCAAAWFFITYMLRPAGASLGTTRSHLRVDFDRSSELVLNLLNGSGFSQFISYEPRQVPWLILLFGVLVASFIGLWVLPGLSRDANEQQDQRAHHRAVFACLCVLAGTFILLSSTPGAARPWHAMAIWPLLPVTSALAYSAVIDQLSAPRLRPLWVSIASRVISGATVAIAAIALVSGLTTLIRYQNAADTEPLSVYWSKAPAAIASELIGSAVVDNVAVVAYTSHWGYGTPVKALFGSTDSTSLVDSWPWFADGDLDTVKSNLTWTMNNAVTTTHDSTRVVLVESVLDRSVNLSNQPIDVQRIASDTAARVRQWCGTPTVPLIELDEIVVWELPCLSSPSNR